MHDYHFHVLGDHGSRVSDEVLPFEDDTSALRHALSADFPQGCEVWRGLRWLGRFCGPANRRVPVATVAGKVAA